MGDTRLQKKPRVFYGYWIVLVAFLCLFVLSGCGWYAFSLFVKPLEAELGWSRGEIMTGFTTLFLTIAMISPFIGRVVDRYGAKKIIVTGALIAGLGFTFLSLINHVWQFYLCYIIIGIGLAAMGQVPVSAIVSNWFHKKRGLAIGIMSIGVGGGGFALAPLVGGYLIPNFGWRPSYLALAIITWVLVIPLALLVIKEKPEDMGLYADGIEHSRTEVIANISPSISDSLTLKMALATSTFWLISISFFTSTFSCVGSIQSQSPHLQDIGFPIATAATALGAVGLASAIGKFSFGWVCDRIPPKYACAIGLGFQLGGIMILINIEPTSPSAIIWLYAIMAGLGSGSWLPTMSMLTSTSFGLASYGAIFGIVSLFQCTGSATGPFMAGYLYDIMKTYHWAFVIFISLYSVALPSVLLIRRPRTRARLKAAK
ncbi:MFS transporter [Chloroflexota bacterium]